MRASVRFFQRFRRLQWKLTLFYILTTLVVLLFLEMIAALIFLAVVNYDKSKMLAAQVGSVAYNLSSNFTGPFINRDQLREALKSWPSEFGAEFRGLSAVLDADGRLIEADGDVAFERNEWGPMLPAKVQQNIQTALSLNPSDIGQLTSYTFKSGGTAYIVSPIAQTNKIRGVLVVQAEHVRFSYYSFGGVLPRAFLFIGQSLILFFLGAAIVGIAFGIVTSRSLVRRIRRILVSADRWSQGDFTTFVQDPSGDELGQLGQRLNQMARQLRLLLRTRQELATLEERNRLARELHDSVKQQMFAVSIWVNTAKSLIGQDEQTARSHLSEAESLISHTQRELSSLIQELRPVALESKDLAHALGDYLRSWQDQTGIAVDFEVSGEHRVSSSIEEAFFRIAQEALSNAARHSKATSVRVKLECGEIAQLSISDNGCGFDARQEAREGVGLSSMRERAQGLDGDIDIRSEKGKGTVIVVRCEQTGI
ncbi:sensor histidine kinase [Paenibacillus caui]|uniref:sensor histidine kinase n=1 Tax=Paenibacillus caui TaxID=2873927 RepID=UPI001CA9C337|nr:sensor histidine kinase [Paenibacillus caui]